MIREISRVFFITVKFQSFIRSLHSFNTKSSRFEEKRMCSISEYLLDDSISPAVPEVNGKCDTICRKCVTEKAAVVLQRKFSYCKSCFLQVVTHKFRSTVGKLKLKQMKDRILLVFSGSQSSVALLHLLQAGMNESNHKKLKFHVDVLVIDDSVLWPDRFDPSDTMSEIENVLKQYPFKRYVVKLSSIYGKLTMSELEQCVASHEDDVKLKRLFAGIKSSTSKMDLLFQLRSRLSYECAALLKCNKIFTSDCGTDAAVRMLSDTILGRYSHIAYDTAVCDTRNADVHCIRPLRELVSKEISFYNVFNGLSLLVTPSSAEMFNYDPSLQWETSLFISNLQEEFPSTVYTVYSIGDKLQKIDNTEKCICALCRMPISVVPEADNQSTVSNSSTEVDDSSVSSPEPEFCHGCQRIVDDLNSADELPISTMR